MTSEVIYQGDLRTCSRHIKSGNELITDAPTDNNGKGEAFSPTDTVATALASCMLTIMGIVSDRHSIDILGTRVEVTKVMTSDPRRISEILVDIHMPDRYYSEKEKKLLERSARTCPVALSLHEKIEQKVRFIYT